MRSRQYTPKPGSVPDRAITYLRTLPPGTEVSTDQLAVAAGFERKNATAFLEPALRGGALARRKSDPANWRSQDLLQLGSGMRLGVAAVARAKPKPPTQSLFEARSLERQAVMHPSVPAPRSGGFMDEWRRLRGEDRQQ